MVLDVAFLCAESVRFLYMGSDHRSPWLGNILRLILALCNPTLAQG